MTYIDISDYQESHYKKILKIIFKLCSTFKIIDSYGALDLENLEIYQDLINTKRSNKWDGTKIRGEKAYVYSFKISKKTIAFFEKNDSFFYFDKDGYFCNSGLNNQYDYRFLEKETNDSLMYVISHEGKVFLRKDIFNKYLLNCKMK